MGKHKETKSQKPEAVVQPAIESQETCKIYMKTSVDKYNAHVRYRVTADELAKLPKETYIIIN